ncbi:MAG: aldo/keto reductase [Fimbriimonadaceae bacterium]|nr:MAG: aldo/keto reductase [Fimbriimonadaceae bacterium]
MERRRLGRTGLEVTALGFGTSEIGFMMEPGADCGPLLNQALDDGLNVIDTAECYRDAEEKIGKAVSHRRDEFHLFTKTGHAAGLDGEDWSPKMMAEGIERSLRLLKTDRVDLVQLHSCSLDVLKQGDVIEVVQRAKDQGKSRFIGYSGDGEAAKWAAESGVFDTIQLSLSVCDQEAIDLVLPVTQANDLGVIVKRPVANAVWASPEPPESAYRKPYWDRLQKLAYPWAYRPEAAGTALRFTLFTPGVTTAIVGTTKPSRWRENAALLAQGPLPESEYHAVRSRWAEVAGADWVGLT